MSHFLLMYYCVALHQWLILRYIASPLWQYFNCLHNLDNVINVYGIGKFVDYQHIRKKWVKPAPQQWFLHVKIWNMELACLYWNGHSNFNQKIITGSSSIVSSNCMLSLFKLGVWIYIVNKDISLSNLIIWRSLMSLHVLAE